MGDYCINEKIYKQIEQGSRLCKYLLYWKTHLCLASPSHAIHNTCWAWSPDNQTQPTLTDIFKHTDRNRLAIFMVCDRNRTIDVLQCLYPPDEGDTAGLQTLHIQHLSFPPALFWYWYLSIYISHRYL